MCASNFDYCGPTVMGGCGEECGLCAPRAGSILTGASQMSYEEGMMYEDGTVIEPTPTIPGELGRSDFDAPIMPRQMVEGEEIEGIIISIEDSKPKKVTPPLTAASDSEGWSVRK